MPLAALRQAAPDMTQLRSERGGVFALPPNRLDAAPWRVRDVAFAAAAIIVCELGIGVALAALMGRDNAALQTLLIALTAGGLLFGVWLFGARRYADGWRLLGVRRMALKPALGLSALTLGASLLGGAIYAAIVIALGLDFLLPSQDIDEILGSGALRALNFAMVGSIAPFAEELFFRGFLMTALIRLMGVARGILVSAAIFAVVHIDVGAMIPIFVTGALLGWLYIRSGSIWPPTLAHAAQNILAMSFANQPISSISVFSILN